MKPTNTHLGITYHWVKSPDGRYVIWLWSDDDNAYGWVPFGWDGLSVMQPNAVPEGWEYVSYIAMPTTIRAEFKRDPDRMTADNLKRVGTMASL